MNRAAAHGFVVQKIRAQALAERRRLSAYQELVLEAGTDPADPESSDVEDAETELVELLRRSYRRDVVRDPQEREAYVEAEQAFLDAACPLANVVVWAVSLETDAEEAAAVEARDSRWNRSAVFTLLPGVLSFAAGIAMGGYVVESPVADQRTVATQAAVALFLVGYGAYQVRKWLSANAR